MPPDARLALLILVQRARYVYFTPRQFDLILLERRLPFVAAKAAEEETSVTRHRIETRSRAV